HHGYGSINRWGWPDRKVGRHCRAAKQDGQRSPRQSKLFHPILLLAALISPRRPIAPTLLHSYPRVCDSHATLVSFRMAKPSVHAGKAILATRKISGRNG